MAKMQYAGRNRKKAEKIPASHYVDRLFMEDRPDFDSYLEIVQYKGGIRRPKDSLLNEWAPRFNLVDPGCRQFYVRGLLTYQGWNFSAMFQNEKNLKYVVSENTLERRLNLLIAQGLVYREPPRGGRGIRGKYFFRRPSEMLDDSGIHFPQVIESMREYIEESGNDAEKKNRLADLLEMLTLEFGAMLASLLKRLAVAEEDILDSKLFKTMNNESYGLDVHIDFTAMRLLLKEYPDFAEDALEVYMGRLVKDKSVKLRPPILAWLREVGGAHDTKDKNR